MNSKPCVPPRKVAAELERSIGDVSNTRPISEGEESRAYSFLSGSQRQVIRLNRESEGFEKDAFAFRRFSRGNLPIPKVIQYFGVHLSWSPELSRRLLCYQLRIGLGEYQNALEGKADAVQCANSRCCELMR